MSYKISPGDLTDIRLSEPNRERSIIQNVAMILNTWKGSVPLYRDFGISAASMHKPLPVAQAMLRAEIREAIERYEPRVEVDNVSFASDGGVLIPTVEVTILE